MRALLIFLVTIGWLAGPADAAPTVLSVGGGVAIVELGAADGVGAGTTLELLHEVVVKDPVTKQTLRDVFPLGTLTVLRAGEHVCEAEPDGSLVDRVKVGDTVRVLSEVRTFADPWAQEVAASREAPDEFAPPVDEQPDETGPRDDDAARRRDAERLVADAAAVRAVWEATLGQPIDARIALWERLLQQDNLYAQAVRDEIASLTAQAAELVAIEQAPPVDRDALLAEALRAVDAGAVGVLGDRPPTRARVGEAVPLAFVVLRPDRAARGWLYARTTGAAGFERSELVADGDGYLRGTIPAALVEPPGVEWFVEVAAALPADAPPQAVLGTDVEPRWIEVAEVRDPPAAPRGRSRVTATFDFVDFDGRMNRGFDQFMLAEVDFMYRFLKPIYAFRLGFGTLRGTGGPKNVIDEDPTNGCLDSAGTFRCKQVAYTYAYLETEHRIRPTVAVMLRPLLGGMTIVNGDLDPAECRDGSIEPECDRSKGFGFRAKLRLGEETKTNLTLGFAVNEIDDDIGSLFEAAYTWAARPELPVQLAVQVTNMPIPEDFGVRLIADVGWRKLSWVYPSLRVSYQARDIDHAGFSGGLGLNFDW